MVGSMTAPFAGSGGAWQDHGHECRVALGVTGVGRFMGPLEPLTCTGEPPGSILSPSGPRLRIPDRREGRLTQVLDGQRANAESGRCRVKPRAEPVMDSPESRRSPRSCPWCGDCLRRVRVPVTVKELILLVTIAAVTGAAVLHVRRGEVVGHGVPDVLFAAVLLFPIATLAPFWLWTHLQKSSPRCYRCGLRWSPATILSLKPVHPVLVLLATLFIYLQYFILAMLHSEIAHWVFLFAVEAAILGFASFALVYAHRRSPAVIFSWRPLHPLIALLGALFIGLQTLVITLSPFDVSEWIPLLMIEAFMLAVLGFSLAYATRLARRTRDCEQEQTSDETPS